MKRPTRRRRLRDGKSLRISNCGEIRDGRSLRVSTFGATRGVRQPRNPKCVEMRDRTFKRGAMRTALGLCVAVLASVAASCATTKGPILPYSQTPGYHAIGASVYGILEKDLNNDGLPDVVVVRQDAKGYRLHVMERGDAGGTQWSKGCATDSIKGEDMVQLSWLGDPNKHQYVMLVVGEENPEELVQHFVVVDPDGCGVAWADMLTVPRRENTVVRSSAMPPEGLSLAAQGNALRLIDHTELVGLQGQEGPVSLLARYRERVGVMQDGHFTVQETTQAVLRKRDVKITWEARGGAQHSAPAAADASSGPAAADASSVPAATKASSAPSPADTPSTPAAADAPSRPVAELTDGDDGTAFTLQPGEAGRLTIDSDEAFLLLEIHHGCDVGGEGGLTLEHSGRAYTTGTTPTEHAPFRAAGRRHPREKAYTQELLAMHDALHSITLDLPASDSVRCLREVTAYGWQE